MKNTNLTYLARADKIASYSKDPSTKVGAFFVDEEGISPIGFGYNGMPRGLPDDDPEKNQRPEKYLWYEHAERNAIYNAAQEKMENAIIFCSHFPNMESARAIVSVGIRKVVVTELNQNTPHFDKVIEMFKITGVDLISLSQGNLTAKEMKKFTGYIELAQDYGLDLADEHCTNKSGVLILNQKTFSPIAMGASGPPPSMKVDSKKIENGETSFWIQEAEKNAIFNAVRPKFKNSTGYVSWCPCAHCALAVASVGTKKVVTLKPDFTKEADLRWREHFLRTEQVFKDMGIEFELVEPEAKRILKSGMKK